MRQFCRQTYPVLVFCSSLIACAPNKSAVAEADKTTAASAAPATSMATAPSAPSASQDDGLQSIADHIIKGIKEDYANRKYSPQMQKLIDEIADHPDRVYAPYDAKTWIIPAGDPDAKDLSDEIMPAPLEQGEQWPYKMKPTRKYRITGTIPPSLRIEMKSHFQPYQRTPECIAELKRRNIDPPGPGGGLVAPLKVTYSKERYEAVLVIDRFDDNDPCQWVYQETSALVYSTSEENTSRKVIGTIVNADEYHFPKGAKVTRCAKDDAYCSNEESWIVSNDDEKPASILCGHYQSLDKLSKYYSCNAGYDHHKPVKAVHKLKPHTRTIEINVYDLDRNPALIKTHFPLKERSP